MPKAPHSDNFTPNAKFKDCKVETSNLEVHMNLLGKGKVFPETILAIDNQLIF